MQDAPSIYRVPPPPPPPPAYRLFTTGQVTAAALLLSPVAGAALVALNRKRVGRPRDAAIALAAGVALTALTILVATAFHRSIGFVPIACAFAARGLAQRDEPLFEAHLAAGGKRASWWKALGIPLLIAGALLGGGTLIAMQVGPAAYPSIEVGPQQHVRYGSGATESDARTAADELKRQGFLNSQPADVSVERRGPTVVVGVVVHDGTWNDPEKVAAFGRIRNRVAARAFAGKDVEVTLLDDTLDVHKTLTGPALARLEVHPNQAITYELAVGSREAERLRDALVANDFFPDDGKPRDAKLAREGDVEVVSFVLGAGRWDAPELIEGFETLRGHLAERGIGNGKVRVNLCDDKFQPKRSVGGK